MDTANRHAKAYRILCAPDSFKGSLTSVQAARAMQRGIQRAVPEVAVDVCPIADGGEGTVLAVMLGAGGQMQTARVVGAMGDLVTATWALLPPRDSQPLTAVVELASASGFTCLPGESTRRDPTRTTTYGTGQLVTAALDAGTQRVLLGLGGSATNDGGCGAAQALGVRFYDATGELIDQPIAGGQLSRVARIDVTHRDRRLEQAQLLGCCDVTNPLLGPCGAARIYAPQKGATPHQVEQLEAGLQHLSQLFHDQLGKDVQHFPGAGAAGGAGGGVVALLGGMLRRGAEVVLDAVDFKQRVCRCDLCLTGEGRLDAQTAAGKAPLVVAQTARRHHVESIALVGSVGPGAKQVLQAGLSAYRVIGEGLPAQQAMAQAEILLEQAAGDVVRQWLDKNEA